MADEWHINVGGKSVGTATTAQINEQLRGGHLTPQDLVWRTGMSDWAQLGTLREFGGEPLPPLPDDSGPFLRVGTTFYLDGQEWVGRSIVSPNAVYLLKGRSLQGLKVGHDLTTSLVKTVVGLVAQTHRPDLRTCRVCELPANVRAELDAKGKKGSAAAVVVRRAAAEFVKVPRIYNVITFDLGGHRVHVVTSWFGVRKVGRWLAAHGWVLNQPLQSIEEPLLGPDFRRG